MNALSHPLPVAIACDVEAMQLWCLFWLKGRYADSILFENAELKK